MGKYDTPNYRVIEKEGMYEIRKYDTFYTSSVSEQDLKGYSGFGILFSYISGNNLPNEKMAMTVPVINTFDQQLSMEFVIPKDKVNQIPLPNNKLVTIKRYDEHYAAVLRFSGFTNQILIEKQLEKLQSWISSKNYLPLGKYQLARYNPPFSIPFMRRNEIIVHVSYIPKDNGIK